MISISDLPSLIENELPSVLPNQKSQLFQLNVFTSEKTSLHFVEKDIKSECDGLKCDFGSKVAGSLESFPGTPAKTCVMPL